MKEREGPVFWRGVCEVAEAPVQRLNEACSCVLHFGGGMGSKIRGQAKRMEGAQSN
jgi:hypothetical protein